MKYYGKKSLSSVLDVILNIVLGFGVILTTFTYYKTITENDIMNFIGIMVLFLFTVGVICTFTVVIELKKVIKTLILENPFTTVNVKSLRKIAFSLFTIGGCYLINLIANLSRGSFSLIFIDSTGVHTDAEIFIFIFAGSFVWILSKVFEQAVKYKEDNDLTI